MQPRWYRPLRLFVGVVFVLAGLVKFIKPEAQKEMFSPYPDFFMPLIGLLEIIGGLALLGNRLVRWAALGLAVIMVGAVITQFMIGGGPKAIPAIVFLVLTLLLFARGQGGSYSGKTGGISG